MAAFVQVGKKIKEIRTSKGVTQVFIQKKLGKVSSWLSRIESGDIEVNAVDLKNIADLLGVKIDEFFLPCCLTNGKWTRRKNDDNTTNS